MNTKELRKIKELQKERICSVCKKKLPKNASNSRKYHKKCAKIKRKEVYTKYNQRPDVKERVREYNKKYHQRLDVKKRVREYRQRPKVKKRIEEYYNRPEVKKKIEEYYTKYNQRPEVKKRVRDRLKSKLSGFVKIPTAQGTKELVYADGVAKEIQKQIPELTQKIMMKLLNKKQDLKTRKLIKTKTNRK